MEIFFYLMILVGIWCCAYPFYKKWQANKMAVAQSSAELVAVLHAAADEYTKSIEEIVRDPNEKKELRAIFILYFDMFFLFKSELDGNNQNGILTVAIKEDIRNISQNCFSDSSLLLRGHRETILKYIVTELRNVNNNAQAIEDRYNYLCREFRKLFYRCSPVKASNEYLQEVIDFQWMQSIEKIYEKKLFANYNKVIDKEKEENNRISTKGNEEIFGIEYEGKESLKDKVREYLGFSGKIGRQTFFLRTLILYILGIPILIIKYDIGFMSLSYIEFAFLMPLMIILAIFSLATVYKRVQDLNKSPLVTILLFCASFTPPISILTNLYLLLKKGET